MACCKGSKRLLGFRSVAQCLLDFAASKRSVTISHISKSFRFVSTGGRDGGKGQYPSLPTEDQIKAFLKKLEEAGANISTARLPVRRIDAKLGFLGHYEKPGAFAFRVGDIVVHRKFGHVGVVAERFDVCQNSEAWLATNAPPGMNLQQPFYSILVHSSGEGFTRHGAQSSHRRWNPSLDGGPPPHVQHPGLQQLFGRLDPVLSRYDLLDKNVEHQEIFATEWDHVE